MSRPASMYSVWTTVATGHPAAAHTPQHDPATLRTSAVPRSRYQARVDTTAFVAARTTPHRVARVLTEPAT